MIEKKTQPEILEKDNVSEFTRLKPLKGNITKLYFIYLDLVKKHRSRTSSIEVIFEEMEDLLDQENNSDTSSEEVKEKEVELLSDKNEVASEEEIEMSSLAKQNQNYPQTDIIEMITLSPPPENESKETVFGELSGILEGSESTFLDTENF